MVVEERAGRTGGVGRTGYSGRTSVPAGGLGRDMTFLERLADAEMAGEPGLGVSAIAGLTGREKSQVSRALGRLAEAGFVERDAVTRRYRIGGSVFALAARAAGGRLLSAASGPMRALSCALGETVHLCVLDGTDILTLATETVGQGIRASGWLGTRVPAHGTSAGRALLIDATPAELGLRFGSQALVSPGPRPRVRDLASLAAVIAEARAAGYAAVDEEFEAGVAGVSAPVRDFRGVVVAALNVSAPAERLRPRLAGAGEQARNAADLVARQLGWRGSGAPGTVPSGPS